MLWLSYCIVSSCYDTCNSYSYLECMNTLKILARMRQHKKGPTCTQAGLRCVSIRPVPSLLPQNHRVVAQQEQSSPRHKKAHHNHLVHHWRKSFLLFIFFFNWKRTSRNINVNGDNFITASNNRVWVVAIATPHIHSFP